MLRTTLLLEKSTPECEDAEPLLLSCSTNSVVLAVFDGLGGAGSTPAAFEGSEHTGAWVASRLARSIIEDLARSSCNRWLLDPAVAVPELRDTLALRFREQAALSCQPGRITSSLIRRLPTTLALLAVDASQPVLSYTAVWAGDSRVYLLTPAGGLRQLTHDDLRTSADALQNLTTDSPLSNYVNADSEFSLNHVSRRFEGPAIFLAASDGCFGYLYSPMHFEHMLLDTLVEANDEAEWSSFLQLRLATVAGDDCSLAAAGIGYATFDEMREAFRPRRDLVRREFIEPLDDARSDLARRNEELRTAETDLTAQLRRSWQIYKSGYDPAAEDEHA